MILKWSDTKFSSLTWSIDAKIVIDAFTDRICVKGDHQEAPIYINIHIYIYICKNRKPGLSVVNPHRWTTKQPTRSYSRYQRHPPTSIRLDLTRIVTTEKFPFLHIVLQISPVARKEKK